MKRKYILNYAKTIKGGSLVNIVLGIFDTMEQALAKRAENIQEDRSCFRNDEYDQYIVKSNVNTFYAWDNGVLHEQYTIQPMNM